MEDWHATLISGFGGAIVGGLAAIVASVWSTRILSRSEVAEHFVSKVGGVMTGIDQALEVIGGDAEGDAGKAVRDARYLLGETQPYLAVVRLRHRGLDDAAGRTLDCLSEAVRELEKPSHDLTKAKASRAAAQRELDQFTADTSGLFRQSGCPKAEDVVERILNADLEHLPRSLDWLLEEVGVAATQ